MWAAVEDHTPWDIVISSPMLRCLAFAEAYAEKHGLQIETDERLKEVGFGNWEGSSSQQILEQNPDAIRNFYHDPLTHRPEGAEKLEHFQQRVLASLQDILKTYRDKNILVVAHAGVMRAAITGIMGVNEASMYRVSIGNAAIVRIKDDGIRPPTVILDQILSF